MSICSAFTKQKVESFLVRKLLKIFKLRAIAIGRMMFWELHFTWHYLLSILSLELRIKYSKWFDVNHCANLISPSRILGKFMPKFLSEQLLPLVWRIILCSVVNRFAFFLSPFYSLVFGRKKEREREKRDTNKLHDNIISNGLNLYTH